MRVATITEAKNGLSAFIDHVRAGESVLIVDRGIPVARLESAITATEEGQDGRLARLQRAGLVRVAPEPQTGATLPDPPLGAPAGAGVLDALLEERRTGR